MKQKPKEEYKVIQGTEPIKGTQVAPQRILHI